MAAVLASSAGCHSLKSCGNFTFTDEHKPDDIDARTPTQVPVAIEFEFEPSICNTRENLKTVLCRCHSIYFLQAVRTSDPYSTLTGAARYNVAPDQDYFDRQTPQGWSLDISPGRKKGYYATLDDGTPVSPNTFKIGSNANPPVKAFLHDSPSINPNALGTNPTGAPSPHAVRKEFITAAVCVDPSADCNNAILGIIYWVVEGNASGKVTNVYYLLGEKHHLADLLEAVDYWNGQLKTGSPTFTREALPKFKHMEDNN